MSESQQEQTPTPPTEAAKLDATPEAAALALAVTSAEKAGEKPQIPEPQATEPAKPSTGSWKRLPAIPAEWRTHGARAAALALAAGLAWVGGSLALSGSKPGPQAMPEWLESATASMGRTQEDIARLTDDMRALQGFVESMKGSFGQAQAEQRSLAERMEGIERAAQEASAKIETASADAEKLAAMSRRLDDIERKVGKATAAADGPAHTGSVPEKAASKDVPVEGWVLRDVFGGVALVESRNGRLHEVVPGVRLPNLGRVEAIERRGRAWVVVTSKGIIGATQRWQ